MALVVLKDASVVINTVDLSDHVRSVSLPIEVDAQEATTMGATMKTSKPGLKDGKIEVVFAQDYASNKVDATIAPLAIAGTEVVVVVKPTSAAVSATNPSYTATVFVSNYSPVDGSVGDLQEAKCELSIASGDIARATSA